MATYVFIVREKYLLLVTAFYLYLDDKERVDNEFRDPIQYDIGFSIQ